MTNITIVGDDGKPILYASLTSEGKLRLQFEYFARDENEGDYEFNHTVEPEEFPKIAQRFGLDPTTPILENLRQISASGRGQEFQDLLTHQKIPYKFCDYLFVLPADFEQMERTSQRPHFDFSGDASNSRRLILPAISTTNNSA